MDIEDKFHLTYCLICREEFGEDEKLPRFLSYHTFCQVHNGSYLTSIQILYKVGRNTNGWKCIIFA